MYKYFCIPLLALSFSLFSISGCIRQTPTLPPPTVTNTSVSEVLPTSTPQLIATATTAPSATITITRSLPMVTPEKTASSEPYPPPAEAYPPPPSTKQLSYPPPAKLTPEIPQELKNHRSFLIDEPLETNMVKVHGLGPADFPIVIVDVTYGGELLGKGTIDSEGKFTIEVPPLQESHVIGIMMPMEQLEYSVEELLPLSGPGAGPLPQVGYIWAKAKVE